MTLDVGLRADANRRWSLNDALTFGLQVSNLNLQYVEARGAIHPFFTPACLPHSNRLH